MAVYNNAGHVCAVSNNAPAGCDSASSDDILQINVWRIRRQYCSLLYLIRICVVKDYESIDGKSGLGLCSNFVYFYIDILITFGHFNTS